MQSIGESEDTGVRSGLELWGGHECTVNRINGRYHDQTLKTGHQDRLGDLGRFASLGLKALRYPVLWERISPKAPDQADWRWTDERLGEIRRLGMRPIAGLVHHGSGPRYTHLLDDGFATGLARHARGVAERYPWLTDYTPVNEPLTTARFSALYGHWYPHARDETAFFTALLNQIDATRLSMREIRKINPAARLIQTDDLGHTFSTPELAYQAEYDNERRWLAWDLLTGALDPQGSLGRQLEHLGLGDRMRAILDDPCPPHVIGVNHYLSSERFLDHRIERYPRRVCGGNGRDSYADVEAVRALAPGPMGLERLLELTWDRYGIPVAVTECHNGCTREEQMRWLAESWRGAERLRARGVPVEAVTVWSLLGSVDWSSLLTRDDGHYEVGVFDIRGGVVRETAMADLCRDLAAGRTPRHPAVNGPGWWSRDIRYSYEPVRVDDHARPRRRWAGAVQTVRPILITGATGTLGRAFARACEHRGLAYALTCRAELDLASPASIASALADIDPWAVINTAGWVRVDDAEAEPEACLGANARGVERLAGACDARDLPLVGFSSDLVFDGRKGAPYLETDAPNPLSVYGRSKALAEQALTRAERGLAIRTAAFFSPFDPHNFAHAVVETLSQGAAFEAADDFYISPTYVPDLVEASLDLLIDGETGIRHLANAGRVSWAGFARLVAMALELDPNLVIGKPAAQFGWAAPRPHDVSLASDRPGLMRALEDAVGRYAEAVRPRLRVTPMPKARPRRAMLGEVRSFANRDEDEAVA
jgi:dTDP-4-dehydrorhamnose reductase